MDESFACPECGQAVKVRNLAPGRQVRCGFCRRLLEVPYMPRVADPRWRFRRSGRPRWVPWAWGLIVVAGVAAIGLGASKLIIRQEREAAARAVERLAEESTTLEANGQLGPALLAIDSAITLACERPDVERCDLGILKERRRSLARRDASALLDGLRRASPGDLPLGEWLGLVARLAADPDLAPLRQTADESFRAALRGRVEADLARAEGARQAGDPVLAFDTCESTAPWLARLPPEDRAGLRRRADALFRSLIEVHGIVVSPLHGELLQGSLAKYEGETLPALNRGLRARRYLPRVDPPGWVLPWSAAPYRLDIEIKESREGNYLSSQNRLTRIYARVRLYRQGREAWQATPTARTTVPLTKLPAYYASRIALSPDRIDEFELLLYNDARTMIGDRLNFAIQNMPPCEDRPSDRPGPTSSHPTRTPSREGLMRIGLTASGSV
ncbi:hypothetical protein OJF2_19920 [Aquisphaera giovannonii]|uniref:Uncharacterized protein n=1 Tax=Aquisphaera giovannonii TaxID=406548 RepID=A0A5B9W0Q3_9BACT|nr:hypothetical protein [Aquisphaera giovannonii]QEH33490.1 hypothetical protein OJF2_19920 [Aquisphaera giovannonii]